MTDDGERRLTLAEAVALLKARGAIGQDAQEVRIHERMTVRKFEGAAPTDGEDKAPVEVVVSESSRIVRLGPDGGVIEE